MLPATPRVFLETIRSFKSRKGSEKYSSSVDGPIELAESWGIDTSAWDRTWSSLSGGEAQRITLSLAVGIPGAEILLLDGKNTLGFLYNTHQSSRTYFCP
jgi:ABC-type dipeptide/oligopeptide/nickel transport system ATPase subunit